MKYTNVYIDYLALYALHHGLIWQVVFSFTDVWYTWTSFKPEQNVLEKWFHRPQTLIKAFNYHVNLAIKEYSSVSRMNLDN